MVTSFGGTKRFIISSGSPFGGPGGYLIGGLYLFVGLLCLVLAIVCGIVHFLMIRRYRTSPSPPNSVLILCGSYRFRYY